MILKKMMILAAFCLVVMLAATPSAMAYPVFFGGSTTVGGSGVDSFGQTWTVGTDSWGIPGLFAGTTLFAGPSSATEFHAAFTDDAGAIDINPLPVPTGFGGTDSSTRFSDIADSTLWTRTISGQFVDFLAPSGATLENGDQFFVNIVFDRDIVGTLQFKGEWLGTTSVPEPATFGLLAAGLVGLVGFARRRRA